MYLWQPPHSCTERAHGRGRSLKWRLENVQYHLARHMLGVKPADHVCMTKAYESLGKTSLRVLLNRRTMAWATRPLAMEDACLPKTVMFSRMAKGRRPRGRPHFRWSDTVKASLAQAGLPAFETWSAHTRNDTITERTQWLITDDCWSVWCIVASLLSCHYDYIMCTLIATACLIVWLLHVIIPFFPSLNCKVHGALKRSGWLIDWLIAWQHIIFHSFSA